MGEEFEARLNELETRLAFQDDTIQALNDVVTQQDQALQQLQRAVELLARRQADLAASIPGGAEDDQPPPHY